MVELSQTIAYNQFINVKFEPAGRDKRFRFEDSRCTSLQRITIPITFVDLSIICDLVDVVFPNVPFIIGLELSEMYELHIKQCFKIFYAVTV